MTKILIEIDTDTQRVVPKTLIDLMHSALIKSTHATAWISRGEALKAYSEYIAAPQPEPVDAALRRDAERYLFLRDKWWFCGVGDYLVRTALTAEELDSAIDSAISQGEQK